MIRLLVDSHRDSIQLAWYESCDALAVLDASGGVGGLRRHNRGEHFEFSLASFMRKNLMKSSCGRAWLMKDCFGGTGR